MITEKTLRALSIIHDHEITSPRQFALFMWPDASGWRRHGKCGHGITRGTGMNLAGGAYLGKLTKWGLVSRLGGLYQLTEKGCDVASIRDDV